MRLPFWSKFLQRFDEFPGMLPENYRHLAHGSTCLIGEANGFKVPDTTRLTPKASHIYHAFDSSLFLQPRKVFLSKAKALLAEAKKLRTIYRK